MSSARAAAPGAAGVDWRRAEFVLTLLAFLGFLALPIRVTTIYSGLPAHPLFVHVPVILVPSTVVTAVIFVFRRDWLTRYGIALAAVSIVAMSSLFLTLQAGAALRRALDLQGRAAVLISEHAQAAHILTIIYVLFTATLIVTFAAARISGGMPTGAGLVDQLLGSRAVFSALCALLVVLSLASGYMCFRTGDLGAKAVWEGRLHQGAGGFPGGFPGGAPGPQPGAGSP